MNNSSKSGLTDKFRPPATKVCRMCKQVLPIKNFSMSFRGRHGYANECRSCKKAHEDRRAEERKERAKTFFDAKFFTLLSLLTASLSGFGQDTKTLEYPPKPVEARIYKRADFRIDTVYHRRPTPDTLRAICLVTLFQNGIAHARMGFVVIEQGKPVVYLDCRKRALKLPQVGWGYVEVNPNVRR